MLKAPQIEHTKPMLYLSQHHPYADNDQHIDKDDEELLVEDLLSYGGDEEGSYTHSLSSGSHYSQKYQLYLQQQSKHQQQHLNTPMGTSRKSTNSSRERDALAYDTRNDTLLLAQFLATTGPEEYQHYRHPTMSSNVNYQQQLPSASGLSNKKQQQQSKRASKILNRFRQKRKVNLEVQEALTPPVPSPIVQSRHLPSQNRTGATTASARKNYIPLPVYEPPSQPPQQQHHALSKTTANSNGRKTSVEGSHHDHLSKKHHPTYQQQHTTAPASSFLRDSGIYSETNSDKDASDINSYTTHTTSTSSTGTAPSTPPPCTSTTPKGAATKAASFSNPATHYQPCLSSMLLLNEFPQPPPLPPKRSHPTVLRTVPEAAKRRSVRLRHIQVQTEDQIEDETDEEEGPTRYQNMLFENKPHVSCPHCRQHITPWMLTAGAAGAASDDSDDGATTHALKRNRPPSCPPGLSSGPLLAQLKEEESKQQQESNSSLNNDSTACGAIKDSSEASSAPSNSRLSRHEEQQKVLLDMIMKLKTQLDEEKQCRLALEKKFIRRVSFISPQYQQEEQGDDEEEQQKDDDQESKNSNTSFISAEDHEEEEEEVIVEFEEEKTSRWTSTDNNTTATCLKEDSFWLNNRVAFLLPE